MSDTQGRYLALKMVAGPLPTPGHSMPALLQRMLEGLSGWPPVHAANIQQVPGNTMFPDLAAYISRLSQDHETLGNNEREVGLKGIWFLASLCRP